MLILIIFAFIGGVVTILSPCVLPVLPIILAGSVDGSKRKPIGIIIGFISSFTFFTLFLSTIVSSTSISSDFLRKISVIILLFFGFSLLIPKINTWLEIFFSKLKIVNTNKQREGFFGGFIIGLSLGLLWTPCVGPILASVITLALSGSVSFAAAIITLAYALGTALPMLAIMKGGSALLKKVPALTNNLVLIQKVFGVLMLVVAVLVLFNFDRQIQTFILDVLPDYEENLTGLENNKKVLEELKNISN